jgi:hypothetical protein
MNILQYIDKIKQNFGNEPVRYNTQKYLQGGRVKYQGAGLVDHGSRVGLAEGEEVTWRDLPAPGTFFQRKLTDTEIQALKNFGKNILGFSTEVAKDVTPFLGEKRATDYTAEEIEGFKEAIKEKDIKKAIVHGVGTPIMAAGALPFWAAAPVAGTAVGAAVKRAGAGYRTLTQAYRKKKNLETFIKSQSNKASKVKTHEKAQYLNDNWMNAINEYNILYHGGNFEKAADALNLNREQVRGIFHRRGKKIEAKGHRLESDLPSGTRTFKEVTTEMKYKPEILRNRYEQLVEEGKIDPKKYYNSKQIANLFDINPSRYHMKEFVERLNQTKVKFKELTRGPTAIKEYQAEDAVNKMLARMKIKKVAGDPKSKSVRADLEMKFDPELTNMLDNIRARTVNLAKETGVYIKSKDIGYFGVGEDAGHAFSLQVMDRYPELFKNSNLRSIQTMVYQDPTINKTILVGGKFQGKQEKVFKQLNQYINKKVSKDNIKQINNLGTELENIHKEIIKSINQKAKDNSYFIGQSKRIPEIKLKKFNVGDTFKSENIFADMSTVDKKFQVGEISKINSKAKKFKDLSKKEQKLYRTNTLNQHIENLEKFYKHSFSAEEIKDLKEAFEYGTYAKEPVYKAEGGFIK